MKFLRRNPGKGITALCAVMLLVCLMLPFTVIFVNALPAQLTPPASEDSAEITSLCVIKSDDPSSDTAKLTDIDQGTAWTSADGTLTVSSSQNIKHLYIEYLALPEKTYRIFCYSASGSIVAPDTSSDPADEKQYVLGGDTQFISEVITLPDGVRSVRLEPKNTGGGLTVLKVFGDGAIPSYVPQWEPTADKAALMVIVAHPDDDILWFGGTLPWYSGVQKLNTVVVYMTVRSRRRMSEALDGLWTAGVRQYPVFGPFPDEYLHPEELTEAWGGEENICSFLTEQIRKYKPDVLMTHGLSGEYGHGAHKVTSSLVCKCADNALSPSFYPELADKLGVWAPKKVYLHAYEKNTIKMNFDVRHDALNGLTGYEIADAAYKCHVSQQKGNHLLMRDGETGCTEFGLYSSRVGEDVNKNDFFENIPITDDMRREPLTENVPSVPFTADDPVIKDEPVSDVSSELPSEPPSSLPSEEVSSEPPSSLPSDTAASEPPSSVSLESEVSSLPESEPSSSAPASSDAVSILSSHGSPSASPGNSPSSSAVPAVLITLGLLLAAAGAAVIISVNKRR